MTTETGTIGESDRELVDAARAAARNTYSPYSHFPVGAALRLRDGGIVTGVNVETGSYGGTICAERSALVAARSLHGEALDIEAIAAVGTAPGVRSCPPCPICRNMIAELMPRDARVVFLFEGRWIATTVADLVPYPFELDPVREAG